MLGSCLFLNIYSYTYTYTLKCFQIRNVTCKIPTVHFLGQSMLSPNSCYNACASWKEQSDSRNHSGRPAFSSPRDHCSVASGAPCWKWGPLSLEVGARHKPKGPNLENNFNLAWKFQSRPSEIPTIRAWWVARLKFSISPEMFNPFFNLWALREVFCSAWAYVELSDPRGRPRNSLFGHLWATFNFSGFRGF